MTGQPQTIADLVDIYVGDRDRLVAALTAREDALADVLRLAGVQFGLYPELVAEVLASVGLGTPPSPEMRELIRVNFTARMEQLRRDYEQGQQ